MYKFGVCIETLRMFESQNTFYGIIYIYIIYFIEIYKMSLYPIPAGLLYTFIFILLVVVYVENE